MQAMVNGSESMNVSGSVVAQTSTEADDSRRDFRSGNQLFSLPFRLFVFVDERRWCLIETLGNHARSSAGDTRGADEDELLQSGASLSEREEISGPADVDIEQVTGRRCKTGVGRGVNDGVHGAQPVCASFDCQVGLSDIDRYGDDPIPRDQPVIVSACGEDPNGLVQLVDAVFQWLPGTSQQDEYAFNVVASKQFEQQLRPESAACAGKQDRSRHVSAPGATRTNCTRIQT
jgi:hypothetical protein